MFPLVPDHPTGNASMPALLVSLIVVVAFMGAFSLAEWGARNWVRTCGQREQDFWDQRADWPADLR